MTAREFILQHGAGARADHLATVLELDESDIRRFRARVKMGRPKVPLSFSGLFAKWRGRPPRDNEWPRPIKYWTYEWQAPEVALLAKLTGTTSVPEIARILTARLRRITGDRTVTRTRWSVQNRIQDIGLQASRLLGGLSVTEAGRRLGSLPVVQQAVDDGRLRTIRIGHRHLIPREAFEAFAAKRQRPPAGWIRLASLRQPLGFSSDSKLPEFAKMGHIPDVVLVMPSRVWYIAPARAKQILDDARNARPLPWHGKAIPDNLKATWKKWRARRHRWCRICTRIWGSRGGPTTFEDFCRRYPTLEFGMKRHLTHKRKIEFPGLRRRWGSVRAFRGLGITIAEGARTLGKTVRWMHLQIRSGVVRPVRNLDDAGQPLRITPAGMKKLRAARSREMRGRPMGQWLGIYAAADHVGLSTGQVNFWGRRRQVARKRGPKGWLYSVPMLERTARRWWATSRFKDRQPPTWITESVA